MEAKLRLQDLAAPAACLRVLIRVHQTIQTIHEEREILGVVRGCHLRDWHDTDAVFLQTE